MRYGLWTPLIYTAFHGDKEVVKPLLANRHMDLNVKEQYHVTAFNLAVSSDRQDVVEMLVSSSE